LKAGLPTLGFEARTCQNACLTDKQAGFFMQFPYSFPEKTVLLIEYVKVANEYVVFPNEYVVVANEYVVVANEYVIVANEYVKVLNELMQLVWQMARQELKVT
jgi:hypothetical protein